MPTNLALLGCSPEAIELIRAAAADPRFRVAAWCGADGFDAQLRQAAPLAIPLDDFQPLASGNLADAVIVSPPREGNVESRQAQLRELAQAEIPLLLVQPACEAIFALELDMIRGDTGYPLLAYVPGERHPALLALARIVAAGDASQLGEVSQLGEAEQILFERRLIDRSRSSVLARLAKDAALLRVVAGSASNVSAAGASSDGASLGGLSVAMTCGGLLARWSALPDDRLESARLVLVCARGRAVLEMPADSYRWQLEIDSGGQARQQDLEHDPSRAALDELAQALSGAGSNWEAACRDLEVVASVEESLRRGRTIAIHEQRPSEEQTFKGLMSVGGCAVLLILLAAALVWAVVEGIRLAQLTRNQPSAEQRQNDPDEQRRKKEEPPRAPLILRMWPVYPLAAFLLLQLLRLVFRKRLAGEQGKTRAPHKADDGRSSAAQ
jgi:hypothetical protein